MKERGYRFYSFPNQFSPSTYSHSCILVLCKTIAKYIKVSPTPYKDDRENMGHGKKWTLKWTQVNFFYRIGKPWWECIDNYKRYTILIY